jgi:hypothetical protein
LRVVKLVYEKEKHLSFKLRGIEKRKSGLNERKPRKKK